MPTSYRAKSDDGDLTVGQARVRLVTGHQLCLTGVERVPPLPPHDLGPYGNTIPVSEVDASARLGHQVVVPVRVSGAPGIGREDDKSIPIRKVDQRRGSRLAGTAP